MSLAGPVAGVGSRPIRKHWLERRRGTAALLVLAPFVAAGIASPPSAGPVWLTCLVSIVGWLLFLVGSGFRLWSTLYIGGRKGDHLVTEGPYSITRNPLYFGTLLIALSIACFVPSGLVATGIVPAAIIYLHFTLRSESRRLTAKHGLAYVHYSRRVPQLWPNARLWRSAETIEVDHRCLRLELWRSLRWLAIPLATMLVSHLRAGW